MAPRTVYVNVPAHLQNGEAISVTTTKGANKSGLRASVWSVEPDPGNKGDAKATFVKANPVDESTTEAAPTRRFENQVKLPGVGGNLYTVKVSKRHDTARFKKTRTLDPVSLQAWRKVYYSVSYMAEFEAAATALHDALGPLFAASYLELERLTLEGSAVIGTRGRVDADGVKDLVEQEQDPPNGAEKDLWVRVTLVKRLMDFREATTATVVKADATRSSLGWTLQKAAPPSFVYGGSLAKTKLRHTISPTSPVTQKVTAQVVKDSSGHVCTVRITQADIVEAARPARAASPQGVSLFVGGEFAATLSSGSPSELLFTWGGPNIARAKKEAERVNGGSRLSVVIEAARYEIEFAPDGSAAAARVEVAGDGARLAITVLDEGWNTRLSHFFAGPDSPAGEVLELDSEPAKILAAITDGANISVAVEEQNERFGSSAPGAIARAVAHEIYHAIGGVSEAGHETFYGPDWGGSARKDTAHCHFGIPKPTPAAQLEGSDDPEKKKAFEPKKNEIYVPEPGATICIMYHRGYAPHSASAAFCDDCVNQLRLRAVTKVIADKPPY